MNPTFSTHHRSVCQTHVVAFKEVAPLHYQISLEAVEIARHAQPGQFVHILTNPKSVGWSFDPLLRRAFSIMSVENDRTLEVLFRAEGRGTQALATAKIGDIIDVIGPLGQPFDTSPFYDVEEDGKRFHVKHPRSTAIVVGGGVGVPPLVFLSQVLNRNGIPVHAIVGARSSDDVICERTLSAVCDELSITTDDGSRGHKGRVTDVLPSLVERLRYENSVAPVVYACGPLPMLRAVAKVCAAAGVRCQVSLEENMPCGIGVCNGCVVRARQPFAGFSDGTNDHDMNEVFGNEWSPYQAYRRVCVEGPACWANEIDWEYEHNKS